MEKQCVDVTTLAKRLEDLPQHDEWIKARDFLEVAKHENMSSAT